MAPESEKRGRLAVRGEQARVLIARLMLHEADVLILDEPTASLDPLSTQRVEELVNFFDCGTPRIFEDGKYSYVFRTSPTAIIPAGTVLPQVPRRSFSLWNEAGQQVFINPFSGEPEVAPQVSPEPGSARGALCHGCRCRSAVRYWR